MTEERRRILFWVDFYKNHKVPKRPTSFARFIAKRIPKGTLLDVGCGNGRDLDFFLRKGFRAKGYDPATRPMRQDYRGFDIIYSRFLLHSMPRSEVRKLIRRTKKWFAAEARVVGDRPILYRNHKRWFVDPKWLLTTLIAAGFDILYFEKGKGLAKYKNEDPLVCRVIAKKQKNNG